MEINFFAETIGYIGAGLYILSYGLVQFRPQIAEKLYYSVLNILGAAFVLFSTFYFWNSATFIIQATWILISFYGVFNVIRDLSHKTHFDALAKNVLKESFKAAKTSAVSMDQSFGFLEFKSHENENVSALVKQEDNPNVVITSPHKTEKEPHTFH